MLSDLPKFHYITGKSAKSTYNKLIEDACMAGVELVHLKVLGLEYDDWLETARYARDYCEMYGVKLVVHNHPRIAKEVQAYALYLDKGESPAAARAMIGENIILGATAHNGEDVQRLIEEGVDYIGIGPFKPTEDKMISAPPLGIEGLQEVVNQLEASFFKLPLIAFGGIEHDDVISIMKTGVHGIGVGNGINKAARRQLVTQEYLALVEDSLLPDDE